MAKNTRTRRAEDAAAASNEEKFGSDVEIAEADLIAANDRLMTLHTKAVCSKSDVESAMEKWRKKNASSIKTLEAVQIRLAAARTALLNEWRPLAAEDQQTTSVEVDDANKADITYFNALYFGFDEGCATNVNGPEKEYWLAAQSFIRVKSAMSSEPAGIKELREAADAAAQAYNWAKAVYDQALANQIG